MKTATKKTRAKASSLASTPLADLIRAPYQAEVERLALKLRPRFESGELRGYADRDGENGRNGSDSPQWKLERLCAEHFGIVVTKTKDKPKKGWETIDGDSTTAFMILAASPRLAEALSDTGWQHVCYWAETVVAWDVLLLARAKGWSRPVQGECTLRDLEKAA